MNKQIFAITLALIATAMAVPGVVSLSVQAQTVVTTVNHFHHGNHFGASLGLGVLGSVINNPCASFPGTVAIQTTNGVTCVSEGNAINDIQGLNEPIIISGFGGHHFAHHH